MKPTHFGILLACAQESFRPSSLPVAVGIVDGLKKSANAEAYGRQIAGLAYDAFMLSGRGDSFACHFYGALAKSASWDPSGIDMIAPVLRALHNFEQQKEAGIGTEMLLKGVQSIPGAFDTILTGGLALGGGLGAAHWALNRDANSDEAESELKKHKIENYHRLAQEIEQELNANPPEGLRKAVNTRARRTTEGSLLPA